MNVRNRLAAIRAELLRHIKDFMDIRKVTEIRTTFSSDCPIIIDGDDDSDTYTLDGISLQTNTEKTLYKFWFEGSSSDYNTVISSNRISVELLADLVDWLEDNADRIDKELSEE